MIGKFWSSPVFGTGFGSYLESTPLSTLAAYGVIGFVFLLGSVVAVVRNVLRMIRWQRTASGDTMLTDMLLANLCAIAVCSVLEASVLGVLNHMVPYFYINMALLCFMVDRARQRQELLQYAGSNADLVGAGAVAWPDVSPIAPP